MPPCHQPQCSHLLSPELASKVLSGTHKPINPHAQRLFRAEVRATRALKADEKKKAQPKAKVSGGNDDGTDAASRTEYTKQKKSFMQGFLVHASFCWVFSRFQFAFQVSSLQTLATRLKEDPSTKDCGQSVKERMLLGLCVVFPCCVRARWKASPIFKELIEAMGLPEAKRRKYIGKDETV